MAGAHGAFHDFRHGAEVKHTCVGFGINFFHGRDECHVYTGFCKFLAVGFDGARICQEVVLVIEAGLD